MDREWNDGGGSTRRIEVVERWLVETRAVALALADIEQGSGGRRLAAVLHQAAALVELVRDGFAVTVSLGGREIARPGG